MTRCLQLGADLEARGENGLNPLHWATQFGTAEAVTALVEARADMDARDEDGLTPLHWTAMVGCAEVVMALLEAGAHPAARDKDDKLPADYAEDNEQIKGTDALRRLNDVRFQ